MTVRGKWQVGPLTTSMELSEYVAESGAVTSMVDAYDAIEAAIRRLDGSTYSGVMFGRDLENGWMGVAGGNEGRYLIFVWDSGAEVSLVPLTSRRAEGDLNVVVGGQGADHPARLIATLDQALLATRDYFESERPSPRFVWAADSRPPMKAGHK